MTETYQPDAPPMDPAEALSLLSSLLRRYKKHVDHQVMIHNSAVAQMQEINDWATAEGKKDAEECARLEAEMRPLAKSLTAEDPKGRKTVSTPAGDVSFREGSTSIDVWAEDDFMAWALNEHPNDAAVGYMIRERPAPDPVPDLSGIRHHISEGRVIVDEFGYLLLKGEDGELIPIPGVRQVKAEETFTVKPK